MINLGYYDTPFTSIMRMSSLKSEHSKIKEAIESLIPDPDDVMQVEGSPAFVIDLHADYYSWLPDLKAELHPSMLARERYLCVVMDV